jgi:hypothetical protein
LSRPRLAPFLCLAWGLASLTPRAASAQNPAAAEALFEQARAAMAAGSFDIACARFRDSDKLDPAVGTRFNLADCEERRGRIATAWSLFRGVLSELAQDDDRRPIAEERARVLEPRMPYLTLRPDRETPRGTVVRIDGVELGEGSFGVPLPMDPGPHELELVRGQGAPAHRESFALREGEHRDLPLQLAEPTPTAASPSPAPLGTSPPLDDGHERLHWAYVAGGVGVAGVALGTVTGIVALNKKSTADANCNDRLGVCNRAGVDANESGKTYATLSALGLGVGVIGLAAGAYLWLTAPDAASNIAHSSIPVRRALNPQAVLLYAPGTGFVAVSGSF